MVELNRNWVGENPVFSAGQRFEGVAVQVKRGVRLHEER